MMTSRFPSFALHAACAISPILVACGDDTTPPTSIPGPVSLSVVVPDELGVGAPLHVTWTVAGDTPAGKLAMRVRGPGDSPITKTSSGFYSTGSTPATGQAFWIAADGSSHDTIVPLSEPATSGAINLVLPSTAQGDWLVEGVILDASDKVLSLMSAKTWVADGPAVRLEMSRTWTSPDNVIHAIVRLRGTQSEPLRLSAWLTLPDDRVLALPNQQVEYVPVMEGDLKPGRIELLGTNLSQYGAGRYGVSLKLETLDGTPRASAGALIRVCSEPGVLTGRVVNDAGVAMTGDLRVFGPDRAIVDATTDADGNFSVSVAAGRHLVLMNGETGKRVGTGRSRLWRMKEVELTGYALEATSARTARSILKRSPIAAPPLEGGSSAPPLRVQVVQDLNAVPEAIIGAFFRRFYRALINHGIPGDGGSDPVRRCNRCASGRPTVCERMLLGEDQARRSPSSKR